MRRTAECSEDFRRFCRGLLEDQRGQELTDIVDAVRRYLKRASIAQDALRVHAGKEIHRIGVRGDLAHEEIWVMAEVDAGDGTVALYDARSIPADAQRRTVERHIVQDAERRLGLKGWQA